jgi:hypothetical protein
LTANAARRALVTYDEEATRAKLERTMRIFTPDFMRRFAGKGDPSAQPVFILGMPRSGSTLVEQILASHPDVAAAGELTDLPEMIDAWAADHGTAWPDLAQDLSDQDLGVLGGRYAAAQKARGPAAHDAAQREDHPYAPRCGRHLPVLLFEDVSGHRLYL